MKMKVRFPAKMEVDAHYAGLTFRTDQPEHLGGAGAAPVSFDYFLASLGTGAGFCLLRFLRQRNLPVDGVELTLAFESDPDTGHVNRVVIDARLPSTIPHRYETAIARALEQCPVRRHLVDPPEFDTHVSIDVAPFVTI